MVLVFIRHQRSSFYGHSYPSARARQFWIYDNDGGKVFDNSIYQCTSAQQTYFVYLWSCDQGDVIGGNHWSGMSFGMPNAWLHTSSLSSDGYESPSSTTMCFIGFNQGAPYLSTPLNYGQDCSLFLEKFYYYSVYEGWTNTINAALNQASLDVWNMPYSQCYLRTGLENGAPWGGNMVVYGDGAMHLSFEGPFPGAGCPLLYVLNGSNYMYQGLLDIHDSSGVTDPSGQDIIRNMTLTTNPENVNGKYLLRLVEHPLTQSFIDQVKLFAVTADGKTRQLSLVSAVNDQYGNVLKNLKYLDGNRLVSNPNHVTDLEFKALPSSVKVTAYIFQIAGRNPISKT